MLQAAYIVDIQPKEEDRMKHATPWLWVGLLAASAAAATVSADDIRSEIGKTYGADGFDSIVELRYTFNIQAGQREVHRSWIWRPRESRVTFQDLGKDEGPTTYDRDTLDAAPSDALIAIDKRFINDQYWLLFALHVLWDRDANVTEDTGLKPLPIGEGSARHVTIAYPKTGGYTPGDVYELYMGEDGRVLQWVYHSGGKPEPSLITTWENQRRFGPLLIPTEFRSADGGFRLWFSDISVKTAD
jgi:hypothetical protein